MWTLHRSAAFRWRRSRALPSSATWSRWKLPEPHTSPLSPPPYMVGAAEIELDKETGEVKVLEFDACVDCGTPINPNLTRVQAEEVSCRASA